MYETSTTWRGIALGITSASINRTTWKEWMKGNRLQGFEDFIGTAAGTLGNHQLFKGTLFAYGKSVPLFDKSSVSHIFPRVVRG